MYKIFNWMFGWDYVHYELDTHRIRTDFYNKGVNPLCDECKDKEEV